ncbi:hypothetical protein ACIHFC_05705 [Streptomyces sp. NPDC052013]|uniref:hypothetical protein n=1 Tax=Streptomyces sp. NPDC052013 TaxID=3365679 RepID=UPI0037CEFB42
MSSRTRRRNGPARQAVGWLATAVAVLGLSGAAWAVPEVREVLQDSFTEREPAYIEMYLAKDPFYDGEELVVPVAITEHGPSGGRHPVKAWVEDADGKRMASGTKTVTTKPGARVAADVRLRLEGSRRDADLVEVSLPGHPHRLQVHLR